MASGVWWVSQRPMFNLRTIRIETMGDEELKHVNHLTLRNNALGTHQGQLLHHQPGCSAPGVRVGALGAPRHVRREWPDQLIVALEEHEALGTWGEDGRLLSTKGDVFTANLAEAEEDHACRSSKDRTAARRKCCRVMASCASGLRRSLVPQALSLSSRYAWTVKLNNGMSVALGREQQHHVEGTGGPAEGHLSAAGEQLQNIDTIDMRYQNGLALSAAGLDTGRRRDGKPVNRAGGTRIRKRK
jgi:cell division protein FtsQ